MFSRRRLIAMAGGQSNALLTFWSYENYGNFVIGAPPDVTTTMVMQRSGRTVVSGNGGNVGEGSTFPSVTPNEYDIRYPLGNLGDDWEVRVTPTLGAFTTGTVGTWVRLNGDRTWTIRTTSFGSAAVQFITELRKFGEITIEASATQQLVAEAILSP